MADTEFYTNKVIVSKFTGGPTSLELKLVKCSCTN